MHPPSTRHCQPSQQPSSCSVSVSANLVAIKSEPPRRGPCAEQLLHACRAMESGQDRHRAASGPQHESAARAACRAALLLAQRFNSWLEEASASVALASAWQAVLEVILVQRCGLTAVQLH